MQADHESDDDDLGALKAKYRARYDLIVKLRDELSSARADVADCEPIRERAGAAGHTVPTYVAALERENDGLRAQLADPGLMAHKGLVYELGVAEAKIAALESELAKLRGTPEEPSSAKMIQDILDVLWTRSQTTGMIWIQQGYPGERVVTVDVCARPGGCRGQHGTLAVALRRVWRLYACNLTLEQLLAEEERAEVERDSKEAAR